jgi:hypothetical protein
MVGVCPVEVLLTRHGHRTLAGLSRGRIITGILQPYADRPSAALSILTMLRILLRHAINIGWLKHHPWAGIKRPKYIAFVDGRRDRLLPEVIAAGHQGAHSVRIVLELRTAPRGHRADGLAAHYRGQRDRDGIAKERTETPHPASP